MTRLDLLLPYRFDPDYVCAGCGGRFAPDETHDYAACADQARGTGSAGIYAADAVPAE